MEHVIVVGQTGCVRSMHSDKFSLGFLGNQVIERASDIRFDNATQRWGIWFHIKGDFMPPALSSHKMFETYEGARNHEVRVMNESLKTGLPPTCIP